MAATAQPQEQAHALYVFPLFKSMVPDLVQKLTDIFTELKNSELLHMLESHDSLEAKVDETYYSEGTDAD